MAISNAYAGGGLNPHGSTAHQNSGATPGVVSSLSSGYVDATGIWILGPYNAWNSGLTYPANHHVLGSNSRMYKAVISNAGNDPTTDGGTNWVRVTVPLLGTSGKLVVSDGNEGVFVSMSGDASIISTGAITVSKSNGNVFPVAATVLGDTWYGSGAAALSALAGNTTATRKFMRQVGNGSISAAPAWDTLQTGDLPAGTGTVTNVSSGNLSPLFTVAVTNPTTTPALAFTAVSQAANLGYHSPDNASGNPTFRALVPRDWASSPAAGTIPYASSATVNAWSAAGADKQTLRMNGTVPLFNSFLANDGSQITIGSPSSPTAGAEVVIKGTGTTSVPQFVELQNEVATDPFSLRLNNTVGAIQFEIGMVGAASDFVTGSAQYDAVIRHMGFGKRMWICGKNGSGDSTGTAYAIIDSSGLVVGGTGAAGAKVDVTANASQLALKLTGVSGAQLVTGAGQSTAGSAAVSYTNTTTHLIWALSSATSGAGGGGLLNIGMTTAPTATAHRVGAYQAGWNNAGTFQVGAAIQFQSTEAHTATTALGTDIYLRGCPTASGTLRNNFVIKGDGDIWCNALNSTLGTTTTVGFFHIPTCSGPPTGVPANTLTGIAPMIFDETNFRLYIYTGAVWKKTAALT